MTERDKTDKFLKKKPVKTYAGGEKGNKQVYGLIEEQSSTQKVVATKKNQDIER